MKKLILVFIFALSFCATALAQNSTNDFLDNTFVITTYYPAPYGVYRNMRLQPSDDPSGREGVVEGVMYYDQGLHMMRYLNNTTWVNMTGGGGGGGYWTQQSGTNNIYNTNTSGNVGIGTTNPREKIHIVGEDGANPGAIYNVNTKYILENANHNILEFNTNPSYVSGILFRNSTTAPGTFNGFIQYDHANDTLSLWSGANRTLNVRSGNVGINTTAPTEKLDVAGNVRANPFFYSSDRSLKENIHPLSNSLDKIAHLQGISFQWKGDKRKDIGLSAQEVEKVYPELVSTDRNTGLKSVEYGNLVAVLVESVKELQLQIRQLKVEIAGLKLKKKR